MRVPISTNDFGMDEAGFTATAAAAGDVAGDENDDVNFLNENEPLLDDFVGDAETVVGATEELGLKNCEVCDRPCVLLSDGKW